MQQPETLPFGIPEKNGYVLTWVRKDKLQDLVSKPVDEGIELLPWACKIAGCSAPTLKKKLFKYRDVLDIANGGCVYFPKARRIPWKFEAPEFKKFVLQHKKEFLKGS